MEISSNLNFFQRLALFQDLLLFEKEESHAWKIERDILLWASSKHHQHLGTEVTAAMLNENRYIKSNNTDEIIPAMNNLEVRGYANIVRRNESDDHSMIFGRSGLLMGKVITDFDKGGKSKIKYTLAYYSLWTLVPMFFLSVLFELISFFIAL
ncbi:hypothetical protein KKH43_03570 [Patescibacteria group bacterium]|nr:hypothetical protein [Patescibacteria group bacterium]